MSVKRQSKDPILGFGFSRFCLLLADFDVQLRKVVFKPDFLNRTAEKKMDQLFEGNICAKALKDWSKIFGESQRDDLESFSNVFLASL